MGFLQGARWRTGPDFAFRGTHDSSCLPEGFPDLDRDETNGFQRAKILRTQELIDNRMRAGRNGNCIISAKGTLAKIPEFSGHVGYLDSSGSLSLSKSSPRKSA
jgi:hypothetical protein